MTTEQQTNSESIKDLVDRSVQSLSDEDLRRMLDQAILDLGEASRSQPNSEWHEACFAAVFTLASEETRRKRLC